jgi:nucleoid-associated protein YgaU
MLLPIAPAKISMQVSNRNETISLINEGEVNFLKSPGLTAITMEAVLPSDIVPFADYIAGFVPVHNFLQLFERLKVEKSNFPLVVSRMRENGVGLHGTSMKVTLEDYEIVDDAEIGFDTTVALSFKQFVEYGTQKASLLPATYTTKKGDTLAKIAVRYYGKSKNWAKIYNTNKSKLSKKQKKSLNKGIKLTIPA